MRRNVLTRAISKIRAPRAAVQAFHAAQRHADRTAFLIGQLHAARIADLSSVSTLRDVEFAVYSQWGEDGIVEHLVSKIHVPNPVFVEFGVENYVESNTRFLLKNRNWSGLVMDGSSRNIRSIRSDSVYSLYDLQAVRAFVTAENINQLISRSGIEGDIGLLSVDVDGNDYWIWRAIDVISPRIIICEYNSLFGARRAVTVPYDPGFQRAQAHYSHLFFGASLQALIDLATEKGYVFVGCNSAGVNAFFVRRDLAGPFETLIANAAYVQGKFRESRARDGTFTFLAGGRREAAIADCELLDLRQGKLVRVGELELERG